MYPALDVFYASGRTLNCRYFAEFYPNLLFFCGCGHGRSTCTRFTLVLYHTTALLGQGSTAGSHQQYFVLLFDWAKGDIKRYIYLLMLCGQTSSCWHFRSVPTKARRRYQKFFNRKEERKAHKQQKSTRATTARISGYRHQRERLPEET